MNPRYIFVSGAIFYLIATLPGDDPIMASYEAQHCDVFGNVKGQPCRPGASYAKHFAVEGLWYLA